MSRLMYMIKVKITNSIQFKKNIVAATLKFQTDLHKNSLECTMKAEKVSSKAEPSDHQYD